MGAQLTGHGLVFGATAEALDLAHHVRFAVRVKVFCILEDAMALTAPAVLGLEVVAQDHLSGEAGATVRAEKMSPLQVSDELVLPSEIPRRSARALRAWMVLGGLIDMLSERGR